MIKNLLLVFLLACSLQSFAAGDRYLDRRVVPGSYAPADLLPVIAVTGLSETLSTTYGSASTAAFFIVSGVNLTAGLTVTAPTGFLVSTSSTTDFANSITVGGAGTVTATLVYIVLSGQDNASAIPYAGSAGVSSTGAVTANSPSYSGTILKAPLTITATTETRQYGEVKGAGAGLTDFTYSGQQNNETILSVTIGFSAGNNAKDPVNTYSGSASASLPSGGDLDTANYKITFVKGDLNVIPFPVTITGTTSKHYGTILPNGPGPFAFAYSALKNGEIIDTVTMFYNSASSGTDTVGIYQNAAKPSLAIGKNFSASNYNITYVAGVILISRASLKITAKAYSKYYGQTLTTRNGYPDTEFEWDVIQNGETIGSVTLGFGLGAAANAKVNKYLYQVTPSAAIGGTFKISNYDISYATGDIFVNKQPLAISADSLFKIYGDTLSRATTQTALASVSAPGLVNGETIGTVSIQIDSTGYNAGTVPGLYINAISPSMATGGTFTYSNYLVTYIQSNLRVNPAPLEISVSTPSTSKIYGSSLSGGIDSLLFTSSGLKNGDLIKSITRTYTAGGDSTAAVNKYSGAVILSAATGKKFVATNYGINYVPSDLIVTPFTLDLSVLAPGVHKQYGKLLSDSLGFKSFLSSRLANGETISSVSVAFGTGAAATDSVGSYPGSVKISAPVGPGLFLASNYAINYTSGPITVDAATLLVSANEADRNYGIALTDSVSSLSFTPLGLQNGEKIGQVAIAFGSGAASRDTVGPYPGMITVSHAAGGTFKPSNYTITYANAAIVKNKAPLTITAKADSKIYGTTKTGSAGSAAFTYPLLPNAETIGTVTIAYGPGSALTDPAGTYSTCVSASAAIGGSFKSSNYLIHYVSDTLSVLRMPLTISAVSDRKTYGDVLISGAGKTNFMFTALANSETLGTVTLNYGSAIFVSTGTGNTLDSISAPIITGAATAPAGNYFGAIKIGSVTGGNFLASNYAITYTPASLTVTPAPLVITASALSKTYGTTLTSASGVVSSGASGVNAFQVTGLKNNETIGSVSSVIGTGGAATDSVGIYIGSSAVTAVTGGTFLASNYSISYVPAAIKVNKAALAILANDTIKTYGTTITGGLVSAAYTTSGLQNGETFGPVTLAYGTGAAATAPAGIYTSSVVATLGVGGSFNLHNYSLSIFPGNITVLQAALTVTLDSVSKVFGTTLTGAAGSSGFTLTGLQNGETAGTITQAYGAGAPATALAGTYAGATTGSLLTGGNFNAANYKIIYNSAAIIVGTGQTSLLVVSQPGCTSALGTISIVNYNAAYTYSLSPAGIATQSGSLISAPAGTYTVTALAPHSFASPVSLSITLNPQPPIPNLVITNPLEVNAPAVVDIKLQAVTALSDAGLTYSYFTDVNGTATLADPSAITTSGVYYIMATNSYGCTSPVKAVFVYVNPLPKLVITNPSPVNNPTTVDLTLPAVTAGSTPDLTYTYFSDSGATILLPDPAAITVSGTYYIRGTNGGGNSVLKPVTVVINFVIFIPNVFTPNGDGKNDRFVISGLEHFPGSTLVIYNRFGNVLYQSADYQNTWDGGGQTAGTYYYQLQLKKAGATIPYKGWVQILY